MKVFATFFHCFVSRLMMCQMESDAPKSAETSSPQNPTSQANAAWSGLVLVQQVHLSAGAPTPRSSPALALTPGSSTPNRQVTLSNRTPSLQLGPFHQSRFSPFFQFCLPPEAPRWGHFRFRTTIRLSSLEQPTAARSRARQARRGRAGRADSLCSLTRLVCMRGLAGLAASASH